MTKILTENKNPPFKVMKTQILEGLEHLEKQQVHLRDILSLE